MFLAELLHTLLLSAFNVSVRFISSLDLHTEKMQSELTLFTINGTTTVSLPNNALWGYVKPLCYLYVWFALGNPKITQVVVRRFHTTKAKA